MLLREEIKDLFSVQDDYHLVQCISADLEMGLGIALKFNEKFDMKNKLKKDFPDGFRDPDDCYEGIGCILKGKVFNLVTKKRYFHKPTYTSIKGALYFMKEICESNNIKKVAMPMIGCGLDKLSWNLVRGIIQDTFNDMDVEILVCFEYKPDIRDQNSSCEYIKRTGKSIDCISCGKQFEFKYGYCCLDECGEHQFCSGCDKGIYLK